MTVLRVTRGDDEIVDLIVRDPNGVGAQPGQPSTWPRVDLSGSTARFVVTRKAIDSPALITKTSGSGLAYTDEDEGEVAVTIDDTDTADLEPTVYRWELQVTDAASKVGTAAEGWLHILPDRA